MEWPPPDEIAHLVEDASGAPSIVLRSALLEVRGQSEWGVGR